MDAIRLITPREVRATIARHMLGDDADALLGDIRLHPHQLDAVGRLRRMISGNGGALLADDVGLGKTYVALAVARDARAPVILSPAALRSTWRAALDRARVTARWHSIESLSFASPPDPGDLVIIDEAHHLRNPSTRRFAAAAMFCRNSSVLLLSATPVQNRVDDLRSLLSLFLGARARGMSEAELAEHCVRRSSGDVPASLLGLPAVCDPAWLSAIDDTDCLDGILSLPPPVLPLDVPDGGVLTTYTLVRQWSSSRAALRQALRRRVARGLALEQALSAGRLPSRSELGAWLYADGAMQLAFPGLVATARAAAPEALLTQVRHHVRGIRALLARLDASPDPDIARAAHLRALARQADGERIVAFSAFGDTISRLYALLAPHVRCAMLTHAGGRVAGGRISRDELLRRFDPASAAIIPASDRVDLLLTTDVLSEGVNLHAANTVIHLDLAWNPARLAQRVGRLRRLGARHAAVRVLMYPPPAPTEKLLHLEQVLRSKLDAAARTVGVANGVLPGVVRVSGGSSVEANERIAALLARWRDAPAIEGTVAAAVCAAASPFHAIACVRLGSSVALLAVDDSMRVLEDRRFIETLLPLAEGAAAPLTHQEVAPVADACLRWLAGHSALDVVRTPTLRVARSRTAVLRRVHAIGRRSSRGAQARWAALLSDARAVVTAPMTAGTEQLLDTLAAAPLDDEEWLRSVIRLGRRVTLPRESQLLAVLLFRP